MPNFSPAKDQLGKPVKKECNIKVYFNSALVSKITGTIRRYVSQNVSYPEQAQKVGAEGLVSVKYDIDKNGKIGNALIVPAATLTEEIKKRNSSLYKTASDNALLQNEALRVIKSMPEHTESINSENIIAHGKCLIVFQTTQQNTQPSATLKINGQVVTDKIKVNYIKGNNMNLIIEGIENNIPNKLAIYNKFGDEVYAFENYRNNINIDSLKIGSYLFTLTVNQQKYSGYIKIEPNGKK